MKEYISNPANIRRIEFWAATTIFVFAIFFLVQAVLSNDWIAVDGSSEFQRKRVNYYFVSRLCRYIIFYAGFLILSFVIVPKLLRKNDLLLNIILAILIFGISGYLFGFINTHLKYMMGVSTYDGIVHNNIIRNNFLYALQLLFLFSFYTVIKQFGLYLLSNIEQIRSKFKFITPGGLVVFVVWMIGLFILAAGNAERQLIGAWVVIIPFGLMLYWYSFHSLIPKSLHNKKPFLSYIWKPVAILVISGFPLFIIIFLITNHEDFATVVLFLNAAFQLLITVPVSWIIFKRHLKGNEEIYALKKELGQSNASFDFLRSQINPHFLFNALNTIYGTAIQEKAERTSEGIEKLGDMMRFMLQENMQEKISLVREIDYLNNYIDLQKLRTDTNPIVKIDAAIEQSVNGVTISPMLLIPFVENAFKHGISLREPSHIKISLEVKGKTLYFDVFNSKHVKQEKDPEKNKSGIGLNNVRQRLQLLYRSKHELVIRETSKDFFVHLTIELS